QIEMLIENAEGGTVVFDLSGLEDVTSVQLPHDALEQLADAALSVELELPAGVIVFSPEAIASLNEQSNGAYVWVYFGEAQALLDEQSEVLREGEVAYRISISSGNSEDNLVPIRHFAAPLEIRLPAEGSVPAAVWHLPNNGTRRILASEHDAQGGTITFETQRLSVFVVGPRVAGTVLRITIGDTAYTLNGTEQQAENAPFIDAGHSRTMVPLAWLASALGATTAWDGVSRTTSVVMNGSRTAIPADVELPNGMGVPAIVNNRLFVPVKYVSELLGATVLWDEETGTVYVTGY
ncbi:MAG: copper amine oxidase N-terminal domain-containing protein, partial [Defluviitaleaceae bacterium]|nr:copper amine oxidase N-terminal domain-containing protein [Defluviitaleaceae bacterium]